MELRMITEAGSRSVSADAAAVAVSRDDAVLWIDLDHTDEKGMALLGDLISVQPGDLQECHVRTPVPKLHAYADHYFSAINGLVRGTDGRLYFLPLKIFFNPSLLVTVLGPTSEALTAKASHRDLAVIREQVEAHDYCPRSAFELLTAIRFELLRRQEELVASAASRVAELERSVTHCDPVRAEALLMDLFGLRHELQTIRTNAAQTRELYVQLIELLESHEGLMQLDFRRLNDLRQGFSHLKTTTDLELEYLQEVLDLFQTRVSTELNRFVRKITAWGSIGISWTNAT